MATYTGDFCFFSIQDGKVSRTSLKPLSFRKTRDFLVAFISQSKVKVKVVREKNALLTCCIFGIIFWDNR